jgi:hypothetical protein
MVLSSAKEQALRTFFKTTTSMGTQSFLVSVLLAGTYEEREANFYGAPPVFTPVAPGYVRAAFTLLVRDKPHTIVYELIATDYINIDALSFGDSPPFGATQTITTLSSDKIVITKPSVASDAMMTWDAWSPWASDGANPPGTGLTWINNFEVYDQDNVSLLGYVNTPVISVAAALSVAQGDMPIELAGSTAYRIGHYDPAPGDNRAGLSLKVETYRPVVS